MLSIFLVGDPRAVIAPIVFPRRFDVDSGRDRFARPSDDEFLVFKGCKVDNIPCITDCEMGSRLGFFANELPMRNTGEMSSATRVG